MVMRAQVAASDIDFVSVGALATVKLDGTSQKFPATVSKIYPQKITLASGEQVYNVDVQSDALTDAAKYGQNGTILITTNTPNSVTLIPLWLLVNHNNVWVWENGKAVLKQVTTGKVHDNRIEVMTGLAKNDLLITDPQQIARKEYSIL